MRGFLIPSQGIQNRFQVHPFRGTVLLPIARCLQPDKYLVEAYPNLLGEFALRRPNWLEHICDVKRSNMLNVQFSNDRNSIGMERIFPRFKFFLLNLGQFSFEKLFDSLGKDNSLLLNCFFLESGVNPICQLPAVLTCFLARFAE